MSLFSEFRDKLKFKTEDKRVRKYTYSEINIREDKETGNLELYIDETYSSYRDKAKGWSTARYFKRDTNIRNPKDKIYYTFVVSPSGHFYRREYEDYNQEKRFGRLYSFRAILQQIFGIEGQQAFKKEFTREELIALIEKINLEKEGAIYQFVDTVQYSDSYKGKKTLEGLHIAGGYKNNQNRREYFLKCVEDEDIQITVDECGILKIVKDGEKEYILKEDYNFIPTQILESVKSRGYAALDGYTFEAIQKVVQRYKNEKNKERGEE